MDAIATAVARLTSLFAEAYGGGGGGSAGGHAHTPARKVVVIEVGLLVRGREGGREGRREGEMARS